MTRKPLILMNETRDSIFVSYGIFAIIGIAAALIFLLQLALGMPEVVEAITQLSPWAGANIRALSWVASGIVLLIAYVIPPFLMSKDINDGGSRLGAVGFAVCVALLIPCIGYLVSIGWFAVKYLIWP
jgi:hypothetical protein